MISPFLLLELLGTAAFAASGALTGISKKQDIFGISSLALVTAVGGGVIRDVVIGNTPPMTFRKPIYVIVALIMAAVLFVAHRRHYFTHHDRLYKSLFFLTDTIGLGVFTIEGMRITKEFLPDATIPLMLFVGVITGVGGGVIRDIMGNSTPEILYKNVYATASVAGAIVTIICWEFFGNIIAMPAGFFTIFVIRALAVRNNWSLPKSK
ncbi:MAG: TRIC cation channel family protein [Spirochaetaceae bacterium]|nr:TRIC cation channel family protein [Spirochaetaceae bacterium]